MLILHKAALHIAAEVPLDDPIHFYFKYHTQCRHTLNPQFASGESLTQYNSKCSCGHKSGYEALNHYLTSFEGDLGLLMVMNLVTWFQSWQPASKQVKL